ncbi:DUF2017 domain-containing protein [Zhihengliuella salsuginis]|uniref:DUF2017 domain-containing protein n=1 Tax=Zhihengliuella salsuginis TaxID=578222 RepID=A0ABQ3GIX2_9MICC|nr:DUF2017 domain-containing protein [Zhihengliuella salsuginis]GHD08467.1 hypothetical protein GCM10008096_20140 [Zhihengliuella salsuginis]
MARAFKHSPRGIVGQLEGAERDLLRNLFDDVVLMLEPDGEGDTAPETEDDGGDGAPEETGEAASGPDPLWALTGLSPEDFGGAGGEAEPVPTPSDPAVLRLLPDAFRDDPEASSAFRAMTERGLRQRKIAALRGATMALESAHIELDEPAAQRFAAALNDVRLVLAERLEIRSDADSERVHDVDNWADAESVDDYLALVYNFVSWVQESLMQALLDTLD